MSKTKYRQRTERFNVDGHEIKVFVKSKSYMNHHNGFRGKVTDNRGHELTIPHINRMYMYEAIECAYIRFVKEFC